jgi:hypothetical protein
MRLWSQEASERKPAGLRPGLETVERLVWCKPRKDSAAEIVEASALARTAGTLARRKPREDSEAEPVRVSARSGTVKTPVRRKPCEDFETETVAASVEAGTAESQRRRKPDRPPDGTQAQLRLRQGTARNLRRGSPRCQVSVEAHLPRFGMEWRFRNGMKASWSSDGSPLVPGNGSDAQSSFPLLNPPTRKPRPTRAWRHRIDAVGAGGNVSPHRVSG